MFFRKKEKPISVKTLFEVGKKSLLTGDYGYMLTKLTTYKDRIEFCFDRVDAESNSIEEFTATVKLDSNERLIPFEVGEKTLFWDTVDEAFRLKDMPEGEPKELVPKVLIYPNDVMTMEQDFAEKYYSKEALSYATLEDGVYIWPYDDGCAAPVVFETPRLFLIFSEMAMHPLDGEEMNVINQLRVFTPSYMDIKGITEDNFYDMYYKNLEIGKREDKK